jgi:hypothetical protein
MINKAKEEKDEETGVDVAGDSKGNIVPCLHASLLTVTTQSTERIRAQPSVQSQLHIFLTIDSNLKTTTTTSGLASSAIGRDGGNVLNSANLQSVSGKGAKRRLGSRTRRSGLVSTSSSDLDV